MQNSTFTPDTSTGFYAALVRDIAAAIVVMGLPVAPAAPASNSDEIAEIIKREVKGKISDDIEHWMTNEFSFADYFEVRDYKDDIWEHIEELVEEKIETVLNDEGEKIINRLISDSIEAHIRRKLEDNIRVESTVHWG